MPSGAMKTDTKYTYTLTTYTRETATSKSSSMSGWKLYDTKETWGSWSGWSRSHPGNKNGREIQQNTVQPTYKTQYNYWGYYGFNSKNVKYWHFCDFLCTKYYGEAYYHESGWVDADIGRTSASTQYCSCHGSFPGYYSYGGQHYYHKNTRQVEATAGYTEYKYRDKIYTYYFERDKATTQEKESSTYPSGSGISNVQEWVRYIEK